MAGVGLQAHHSVAGVYDVDCFWRLGDQHFGGAGQYWFWNFRNWGHTLPPKFFSTRTLNRLQGSPRIVYRMNANCFFEPIS